MTTQFPFLRRREFAYSTIFSHPPLPGGGPAFQRDGTARADLPAGLAGICKNESNCTVFLADSTWITTWSQGSFEHALDERVVLSVSHDRGRSWSSPRTVIGSTAAERRTYAAPIVVPGTNRMWMFLHAGDQSSRPFIDPSYDSGNLILIGSEDGGESWSDPVPIVLPERDLDVFPDRFHGWINHPPQIMPDGQVVLPITRTSACGQRRRAWQLHPAEGSFVRCDGLLTERDPRSMRFSLLPEGPRGVRVDAGAALASPALQRLCAAFDGLVGDSGWNFQEPTVVVLADGRWLTVGRSFLGSPAWSISRDGGRSWTPAQPLRWAPEGDPIPHPMTMCPLSRLPDGRLLLLFTNNDGSSRGARHVWDGDGRTRNPQWFAIGRQIQGEERNAGLVFGRPRILAEVDDGGAANLKTGISMPYYFHRDGGHFVAYNINKEHVLLDEIPADVLDGMTP